MSIEAVLNLHREGTGAQASLVSAWHAVQNAQTTGLDVTLTLVLDAPDEATASFANEWSAKFGGRVLEINEQDLGAARNAAVENSNAEWIAFLDGDDLWSENWLIAAHRSTLGLPVDVPHALHPHVNVIFGDHHSLLHHIDSTHPEFRWSRFALQNMWTALSFTRRQTLIELPYPRNDLENGFGFEDWSWNMAVLDSGGRHVVVADTCHFIQRTNSPSLLSSSQEALRSPYDSVAPTARQSGDIGTDLNDGAHSVAPVVLNDAIMSQVRLAIAVEPAIGDTISAENHELPQNFNTYRTPAHAALEELWTLSNGSTAGDACDQSSLLARLSNGEQAKVTAEFARTHVASGDELGTSTFIDDALTHYPQLKQLLRIE